MLLIHRGVSGDILFISLPAAVWIQRLMIVMVCCEVGDVNQSNEDGLTVLHNGVCSGSHEVLEFLVHAGCAVNVADCDGWFVSHIIMCLLAPILCQICRPPWGDKPQNQDLSNLDIGRCPAAKSC